MKRMWIKVADFPNVAASAFQTLPLPRIYNCYGIRAVGRAANGTLCTAPQMKSDITYVRVRAVSAGKAADGSTEGTIDLVQNLTPTDLYGLDDFHNDHKATYTPVGVMPIDFTRGKMPFLIKDDVLGIGPKDFQAFDLSIQFDATKTTLASLAIYMQVDYEPVRSLGQHLRLRYIERSYTQAATENVLDYPTEDNTGLLAMHIHKGSNSGVISNLELNWNRKRVFDMFSTDLNARVLFENNRVPITDFVSLDFQGDRDYLPMSNKVPFDMKVTWSTAPNAYKILEEGIHGLKPLV